ncbi:MAG: SCO family protein [Burkholderiaceae bacterium]
MRLLLAILLVSALGVGALYAQTDGFTVVTTESARRISIADHPKRIPDTTLSFANGTRDGILHDLRSDGRVAIVNFIYTRCTSVCLAMGSELQQMQNLIREHGLTEKIRLISISFDPADTSGQLARYAQAMRADPAIWGFAGIPAAHERDALLNTFGIIRVAAPFGQFEHNAAYHVVTANGFLARIVDYAEPRAALEFAVSQTGHSAGVARVSSARSQ